MKQFITLIKREYWENRGSFAITPLSIAAFFIIIFIFALLNTEHMSISHGLMDQHTSGGEISGHALLNSLTNEFANLPLEKRQDFWRIGLIGIGISFTSILVLVSFIYLLGSLYDDRKDRSILFWKSLPVSDLMTVASKIVTVLFIIPAFFIAAAAITFLLLMLIMTLVAVFSGGNIWESIWQPAPFLIVPLKLYFTYLFQILWAAPLLGWLILVSSWTKRKPILLTTIPIAVISFLEFYYNRTTIFFGAVKDRIVMWFVPVDVTSASNLDTVEINMSKSTFYNDAYLFMNLPAFWYGLLLAAIMVAMAVYIRRYRDDS